jgi:hypothetical protein
MRSVMMVVFGVMLGSACGYADPISQSRYGGRLALSGDEDLAMEEAVRLMKAHCGPGNYEVDRIEEVVVDEEDYVRTESDFDAGYDESGVDTTGADGVTTHDASGREGGSSVTETRAGTEEVIEIHVSYRCLVPTAPPL